MTLARDKAVLRKSAYARRAAARAAVDPAPALAHLLAWIEAQPNARRISGYAAIRTEVDPLPVLLALAARGVQICLPVVVGAARPLVFRAWTPGTPLEDGAFGAAIPPEDVPEIVPDLLIVPLLAFDRKLFRLGYGGGFYDRTIAQLRTQGAPRTIGLAYAAQEVETIPTEPTDLSLDAIATEQALHTR